MEIDLQNATYIAELVCKLTRGCTLKEEHFSASFGLSPTEVKFLKLFTFKAQKTIKDISFELNISAGRVTHIVNSLENKKLIVRTIDPNDKRNTLISVSSRCLPLINNLNESYSELHKNILESINEDEQRKIIESLEALNLAFEKWNQQK